MISEFWAGALLATLFWSFVVMLIAGLVSWLGTQQWR